MEPIQRLSVAADGVPTAYVAAGAFTGRSLPPRYVAMGDTSTLTRNVDLTWTRSYSDGSLVGFDSSGRQTSLVDRNGNTVTYTYVAAGLAAGALETMTDPVGLQTTLAYDVAGHLSTITDPAGRITQVTIDAAGNLTRFVDPDGAVTDYGYANSSDHRVTSETNPNGRTATAHYDAWGRLAGETLFDGTSTTSVAPGDVQGLMAPGGTGPLPMADTFGGTVTDPNGRLTRTTLDAMGHATAITDPLGKTTTIVRDMDGRPIRITDPLGRVTKYVRDGRGNPTRIEDSSYIYIEYDPTFNVPVEITDEASHVTTFALDAHGNVNRRTDPDLLHEDFTYTASGRLATRTDRNGQTTTYHYDARGRIDRITDPDATAGFIDNGTAGYSEAGGGWSNTSDPASRGGGYRYTFAGTGSRTATWQFTGLAPGDYVVQADWFGRTNSASNAPYQLFDGATLLQTVAVDQRAPSAGQDYLGQKFQALATVHVAGGTLRVVLSNNANGLVSADAVRVVAMQSGASSSFAYDAAGNLTAVTDELGHVTTTTYDLANRVLTTRDPVQAALGVQSSFTYDAMGGLLTATDALGHATTYGYDDRNRLTSVVDPANQATGLETVYTYDGMDLTSVTDPLGHATNYVYDAAGRVTTVTDALNHATTYARDAAGQVTTVTDANGHATAMTYDLRGRVKTVTRPGTAPGTAGTPVPVTTTYHYSVTGDLIWITDPLGRERFFQYDALHRPTWEYDNTSHDVRSYYDGVGNLIRSREKIGNITVHETLYDYDERGRLVAEKRPTGGGTTSYAYDAHSRLTRITDPVGNVTAYGYDAADRVTTVTDPRSKVTTSAYDAVGNLTRETDRLGRIVEYGYDANDRPTTEAWVPLGGGTPLRTITTSYDAAGRVTGVADPDSQYAYTYDAADRMTGVDNLGTPAMPNVALTIGYDAAGNRTSLADGLGGLTSYAYDERDWLTRIEQSGTGVAPKRVDLAYNAAGYRTGLKRYADLAGTAAVLDTAYTYDTGNRLAGLTHRTPGGTTRASYTYTLDKADRLTQEVRTWTTPGGTTATDTVGYAYTLDDQLTGVTHTNGSFANESFAHDANGNRTTAGYATTAGNRLASDGTNTYAYDDEGNLTSKTTIASGNQTLYTYDHRNRLTAVDSKVGGVTTRVATYTYDALDRRIGVVAGSTSRWTAYDGGAAILDFDGAGAQVARYLQGAAVDEVLARETAGGTVAWYLADRLGTIRDLADNAGTIIDHVDYSAFGKVTGETAPALGDRYKYTGREYDGETGLYYYRARYFDAAAGRFLGEDPQGFGAGDANLYRYVGNGPTNLTDPSGENPFLIAAGFGAVIGGGFAAWNGGGMCDVLVGAAIGAGAGFAGGVAAAGVLGALGGGLGAMIAAGAVGGGVGDFVGQGLGIGAGMQSGYSPRRTLVAAGTGGLLAGGLGLVARSLSAPQTAPPPVQTNAQLVQSVATRADQWGTRQGLAPTGSVPGTIKHGYADRLLTRYQRMYGDRGLSTEVRYRNGQVWQPGMPRQGSIRLDVVQGPVAAPTQVWDYKFGGATLGLPRIAQIRVGAGLGPGVPIGEVKP